MKKITILVRRVIKAPLLLLIAIMSRAKRMTLHERSWVPLKLELLFDLYEKETTRFFKKNITKGMVVVDVGANLGYYTRIFSKLVGKSGKVYAFEPDEKNFQLLLKNTSHLPNVVAVPYAVSDMEGESIFYHIPRATSSHTMVPIEGAIESMVKTVTLDSFIHEKIDAIKIDVEGLEEKVLHGMKEHLTNPMWVVFEYTTGASEPLAEELSKSGTIYSLTPSGDMQPFSETNFYPAGRGGNPYANIVYRTHGDSAAA